MSKVISAELKKQVSKPGIFILAVLLAIILVLGVFIYKPTEYVTDTSSIKNEISSSTVTETFAKFYGDYDTTKSKGLLVRSENELNKHLNAVKSYKIDGLNYSNKIATLYGTTAGFKKKVTEYKNMINLRVASMDTLNAKNIELIASLDTLKTTIYSALQNDYAYPIITSTSNYDELETTFALVKTTLTRTFSASDPTPYDDAIQDINKFENQQQAKFENCLNALSYPVITDSFIDNYTAKTEGTKYETTYARLTNLMEQIMDLKTLAQASTDENTSEANKTQMQNLICTYLNTTTTYNKLIENELLVNAISTVGATEQLSLYKLGSTSLYDVKTNLIKYNYLFDTNKTDDDYAHPLTIGVTSNTTTNAYDYAYFILNLFAIVIIAYAVLCGCNTIAGEMKDGTIRYLAIRPVGRRRMFFGKLFSILIMSAIFIIFSAIIAFLAGGFIYSFESLNVLTIFNGTTAIVLPAMAMFGIYLLSLFVEVAIYVSIAMLIATLVKSDLLAVTIVLLLYLINLVLPIFTGGLNSWLAFYPFSHISLYSLFGSSIYANTGNFFYLLLGAKVYSTSSIVLTSVVVLIILLGVNLLSSTLFKKKEL